MDRVDDLLTRTSRTFALTIPYLPEPTRREVSLAYLLLRITDTLEDATTWSIRERQQALQTIATLFTEPCLEQAALLAKRWLAEPPCDNADYLELLSTLPALLNDLAQQHPDAARIVRRHCQQTALGMAELVGVALNSVEQLQRYCYVVAGLVGEMLTALFLRNLTPTLEQRHELESLAVPFGEGLQLVNILKDSATDEGEGRLFLPPDVPMAAVFALAAHNLTLAQRYCEVLASMRAPTGYLFFTRLPIALASATLERVQRDGAGAKLSRAEVAAIQERVAHMIHGQPNS